LSFFHIFGNKLILMDNFFGQNLKVLRKRKRETLESLAKSLNISKSAISDYETGKSHPSLTVSNAIANYFEINISFLQNSNLSELNEAQIIELIENPLADRLVQNTELENAIKQLEFHNKLLGQQVDGLNIQLQLVKQIVESKDAEIKSLLIQVRLLEEKFNREST
jgi:transcriptional regulator with XRE-family HTH domain